jgi:chorismate-pyruvate lyase
VDVLRTLSNRPLAEVLFTDHRWHRISPPIPLLLAGETHGRACLWQYGIRNRSRILVEEFFLPALIAG